MALCDLPPEILHSVCQQLPLASDEHFALRRVCRVLADVAAEYILHVLNIHFSREHLEDVEALLSRNLRIGKAVRAVHFHTDRLHHWKTYEEWDEHRRVAHGCEAESELGLSIEETMHLAHGRCSPRETRVLKRQKAKAKVAYKGTHTKAQLRQAWHRYQEMYVAERELVQGNELATRLARLFKARPHITQLLLDDEVYNPGDRVKSYQEAMCFPFDDPDVKMTGVLALTSALRAAEMADIKLRHLHVRTVSYHFFTQPDSILDAALLALQSVKLIDLEPHRSCTDTFPLDSECLAEMSVELLPDRLARFLTAAPRLEKLRLLFPGSPDQRRVALSSIVGVTYWPALQMVELEHFQTIRKDLVDFFCRHRDSLGELTLANVRLIDCTWDEVFKDVAGRMPKLELVRFEGLFLCPEKESCYCFTTPGWRGRRRRCAELFETYVRLGGDSPKSKGPIDYKGEVIGADDSEFSSDDDSDEDDEDDNDDDGTSEVCDCDYCRDLPGEHDGGYP